MRLQENWAASLKALSLLGRRDACLFLSFAMGLSC
jgi:hypothetical protein